MPEDVKEALTNAWQALCACAPERRPIILEWIDRLLDKANETRHP